MGPFLDWPLVLESRQGLLGLPWYGGVCGHCPESYPGALCVRPAQTSALSPVALSAPLQLTGRVCTVGPPWVPVFMI